MTLDMLRLQIVLEKFHVDSEIIRLHTIMQVVVCFAAAYNSQKSSDGGQRARIFAERLSARQLILRRISEIVCMYPSRRLGIQLFRALRANVVSRAPVINA